MSYADKVPDMVPVWGYASRELDPRRVRIQASLRTENYNESSKAMQMALRSRQELLSLAKDKLPKAQIEDTAIQVLEDFFFEEIEEKEVINEGVEQVKRKRNKISKGFFASCGLAIESDASDASEAFAVLTSAKGWSVASPNFFLPKEDREKLSLELRAEAIRDSRQTAEVLAEAAGLEIVGVSFLGEKPQQSLENASPSPMRRASSSSSIEQQYEESKEILQEIKPGKVFFEESFVVYYNVRYK